MERVNEMVRYDDARVTHEMLTECIGVLHRGFIRLHRPSHMDCIARLSGVILVATRELEEEMVACRERLEQPSTQPPAKRRRVDAMCQEDQRASPD